MKNERGNSFQGHDRHALVWMNCSHQFWVSCSPRITYASLYAIWMKFCHTDLSVYFESCRHIKVRLASSLPSRHTVISLLHHHYRRWQHLLCPNDDGGATIRQNAPNRVTTYSCRSRNFWLNDDSVWEKIEGEAIRLVLLSSTCCQRDPLARCHRRLQLK